MAALNISGVDGVDATAATRVVFLNEPEGLQGEGYPVQFTHQMFEDEKIHGYASANIKVAFAAGSMRYHYIVRRGRAVVNDAAERTDIEECLSEYLSGRVTGSVWWLPPSFPVHDQDPVPSVAKFNACVSEDHVKFRPVGTKAGDYRLPAAAKQAAAAPVAGQRKAAKVEAPAEPAATDMVYEIYRADPKNADVLQYHRNVEVTAYFYIDAASMLEEDHPWEIFYIYACATADSFGKRLENDQPIYVLVGYATVALFYHYPDKQRRRIAQFLVLPPYQRKGHGQRLYKFIMDDALAKADVSDLAIEAPADEFQTMRDRCDLERLLALPDVAPLVKLPLTVGNVKALAAKTKLSRRQATRVLEIMLLKQLPATPATQREYRLTVKARLARENEISIAEVEGRAEKQAALKEMYRATETEYRKVLSYFA